jgi:hypothetical protein
MIEVAMTFLIFISLILFFIWYSVRINAESALGFAMREGLRMAVTRGDHKMITTPNIASLRGSDNHWLTQPVQRINPVCAAGDEVECFVNFNVAAPSTVTTENLISRNSLNRTSRVWVGCGSGAGVTLDALRKGVSQAEAETFYRDVTFSTFQCGVGAGSLVSMEATDAPPMFRFILAYIYQFMVQSLGASVKFPCQTDPSSPIAGVAASEPGCLMCEFLNPTKSNIPDPAQWRDGYNGLDNAVFVPGISYIPQNEIFIRCSYRPTVSFLDLFSIKPVEAVYSFARPKY